MDNRKKNRLTTTLLVALFLTGLSLLLYPSLSDCWNSFHQSRAVMGYMESVGAMDEGEYDAILSAARAYNAALDSGGSRWFLSDEGREAYRSELSFDPDGAMGVITIEKIHVRLPIYHGTSDAVLQTSIGHLEWTSLPVGGAGSHCVLSGHRGLPSAKLFSDLDKLVVGDLFTLSVLNETLSYQVDQIRVVEPADVSALQIVPGEDYCTLLTCTPYAINTHRLLVRGRRVENPRSEVKVVPDAMAIETIYVMPFVGVPILLLVLVMLFFSTGKYARGVDGCWELRSFRAGHGRRAENNSAKSADP